MFDQVNSTRISRRDIVRIMGGALALGASNATPAFAQVCATLPTFGKVHATNLEVTVNNVTFSPCQVRKPLLPALLVGVAANNKACTIELAGGITISVNMALAAVRGAQPPLFFGKLGFMQFTQYTHQRAPAGLGPGSGGYACARSTGWELDGGGPNDTYNGLFPCVPGANKLSCVFDARSPQSKSAMADDPGVPTEDTKTAYDRVWVGLNTPDMFRTWVVWDDDNPATPDNAKRHPVARIDWAWQGQAGQGGPDCPSAVPHQGASWGKQNASGGVNGVFFGRAAGTPPTKFMRAHNNAWVPGKC